MRALKDDDGRVIASLGASAIAKEGGRQLTTEGLGRARVEPTRETQQPGATELVTIRAGGFGDPVRVHNDEIGQTGRPSA